MVLIIIALAVYVGLYTDLLWYRSVDYASVFTRRLMTQVVLFVVFGTLMAAVVGANIVIAYRLRPAFRPRSPEQQQLEMLTQALAHIRRWVFVAVVLAV